MLFDINQTDFPSKKHKAVWFCGVLVMPEELSLSVKVMGLMDADLYESCRQMRLFMLHTLSDIYENAERYEFEPWQLFSFWLNLANNELAQGQRAHDRLDVTASMRSKTMAANAKGLYADVLAHTGIEFCASDGKVEAISKLYPKMFDAMKAMQKYVRDKKERASLENSFQICDFRKICPGYKYDKLEKRQYMREIEDRIPLIVGADVKEIALGFALYLREKKINLKWTGIQNGYSETGQTHFNQGLCHIELKNDYWDDDTKSWRVCVPLPNIVKYGETIIKEGFHSFVWEHIYICNKTAADACNGGEKSIYACHRGIDINVLGKEIVYACRLRNGRHVSVYVYDPDETVILRIKRLLELEQNHKQKAPAAPHS
ncbi:MAG: hypothetical protein FWH01_04245 [Oscillospiraceae bacterium]|nr:hypothetical protein [Oscillospiraceae bacterium]